MTTASETRLAYLSREARANARYVSLHTMNPGSTGAHEVSVPRLYTRQPVEWDEDGKNQYSCRFTLDRDDGRTTRVAYIGFWDTMVGGAFQFANVVGVCDQCQKPMHEHNDSDHEYVPQFDDVADDYEIAPRKLSITVEPA